MRATGRPKLFWIGLLIYVFSFFLVAVAGQRVLSGPARGYHCASYAFLLPLQAPRGESLTHNLLEFISLLISGWINPVFLIAVALFLNGRHKRSFTILRVIIFLMIPFCWIVFFYEGLYPREGYFLWIMAMLLVLFSDSPMHRSTEVGVLSAGCPRV